MDGIIPKFSVKTAHYILAGFGVVTAISWNNTIKETVEIIAPTPKGKMIMNIIYSLIITLMLIILIHILPETKNELPIDTQQKIMEQQEQSKRERLISKDAKLLFYI